MATFAEALDYARKLLDMGDLNQAEVIYRRLIDAAPAVAVPWYELGILHLRANRPEAARDSLLQAVVLDPNEQNHSTNLAAAYLALNQPHQAIACFEQAFKLAPPPPELLNNYAISLNAAEKSQAALRIFDEALRMRPEYADCHFNRANLLFVVRRMEEAVAGYERVIELQPHAPYAFHQLGLAHLNVSRSIQPRLDAADTDSTHCTAKSAGLARALGCVQRSLELKPDYAKARASLAVVLGEQSAFLEAADGCRRAQTLDEQGRIDEAAVGIERALAIMPSFAEAHLRLGLIRAKQNRGMAAIACFRQAIALDPGRAQAFNQLGLALMGENRLAEAAACLRQLLNQEPGLVEARNNLERALALVNRSGNLVGEDVGTLRLLDLQAAEKQVTSQNGEDGVIEAIFAKLGTTNKFFVEFGCGSGIECNGAYLLAQGWSGLQMDGQQSNNALCTIHQEFITAENINDVFHKYSVPEQFDLLSIDVDGNDFWIWQQIEARPRVVVIEYNASIPPNERLSIAYDPKFAWDGSDYQGASLLALKELGQLKGYTLAYCERAGVNAFFVANEALPQGFEPLGIEEIYRLPNHYYSGIRHPQETERKMIDPFAVSR